MTMIFDKKSMISSHELLRGGGRPDPEDSKNVRIFALAAKLKELEQF